MIKLSNGLMADISTLRLDVLKRFPRLEGIRLHPSMGSGCFLDPPGFPSYFLRMYEGREASGYGIQIGDAIYQVDGDHFDQRKGWSHTNWTKHGLPKERQDRLKLLYSPLAFDNPRVRQWVHELYRHLHHCYRLKGEKDTVIFPTQSTDFVKQGLFVAEPKFDKSVYFFEHLTEASQERLKAMQAELKAEAEANVAEKRKAFNDERAKLCTPDRHAAVLDIREFYPDYEPELDLIEDTKGLLPTNWWTVLAELPDPCPLGSGHPEHMRFVCQYCGRKSDGIPDPATGQVFNGAKDGNKEVYAGYAYHNAVATPTTADAS
jgi:hypothetical protein